jgi:hypothetical protein
MATTPVRVIHDLLDLASPEWPFWGLDPTCGDIVL